MTSSATSPSDELAVLRQENARLRNENQNLSGELHDLENKYSRILIEGTQKEQQGRPMRLLHNAQDGVFFSNAAGEVVFINPYLSTILGLGDDEKKLLGNPLPETVWDDTNDLKSINQDLTNYGQIKDRLIIMRNANNGERVYVSMSSVAVRDPYGKIVGAQHVLCNITSKMRITEELRVRNQFLAVLTNFIALLKGNADISTLLSQSLDKLLATLATPSYGAIYLRERNTSESVLVVEHIRDNGTGASSSASNIAQQTVTSSEPIKRSERQGDSVVATVGVPMMVGGNTIGALVVAGDTERTYTDNDIEMLTLMAAELALAVEYNWLRSGVSD